jgi:hypothetical protein
MELEPESNSSVTFVGPSNGRAVVVNGWQVPLLEAFPQDAGRILLVVDGRLGAEFSVDEAERVIPFLANSIAVALGYPCHPSADAEAPLPKVPHARPRRITSLVGASTEPAG